MCPAAEEESGAEHSCGSGDVSRAAGSDSDMELGQRCRVGHLLVSTRTCLSPRVTCQCDQPGSAGLGGEVAGEELLASTWSRLAACTGCPASQMRLAQKNCPFLKNNF